MALNGNTICWWRQQQLCRTCILKSTCYWLLVLQRYIVYQHRSLLWNNCTWQNVHSISWKMNKTRSKKGCIVFNFSNCKNLIICWINMRTCRLLTVIWLCFILFAESKTLPSRWISCCGSCWSYYIIYYRHICSHLLHNSDFLVAISRSQSIFVPCFMIVLVNI